MMTEVLNVNWTYNHGKKKDTFLQFEYFTYKDRVKKKTPKVMQKMVKSKNNVM